MEEITGEIFLLSGRLSEIVELYDLEVRNPGAGEIERYYRRLGRDHLVAIVVAHKHEEIKIHISLIFGKISHAPHTTLMIGDTGMVRAESSIVSEKLVWDVGLFLPKSIHCFKRIPLSDGDIVGFMIEQERVIYEKSKNCLT